MSWKFQRAFQAAPLESWIVHGQEAGQVRYAHGLTFLRVYNSGHVRESNQTFFSIDIQYDVTGVHAIKT
jgi:hypothetical protein